MPQTTTHEQRNTGGKAPRDETRPVPVLPLVLPQSVFFSVRALFVSGAYLGFALRKFDGECGYTMLPAFCTRCEKTQAIPVSFHAGLRVEALRFPLIATFLKKTDTLSWRTFIGLGFTGF